GAGYAVQVDSEVVKHRLDPALAEQGVIVTSMEEALARHPDLVQEHFFQGGGMDMEEDHFLALHAALWSGGLFVYVPQDVEVQLPVSFFHTVRNPGAMAQPHNMIIVDRHARLHLYEEYFSTTGSGSPYSGANTFLHLKDGSEARVVVVQRWGHNINEVSKHQRSEEHTSELQSRENLVCRLLLEKKKRARVR